MASTLIESAQSKVAGRERPHLVEQLPAGAVSQKGKLVERPDES
jgi:hypothetical protein